MEEEGSGVPGKETATDVEGSKFPRALERVFCWLEEVEAGQQVSGSKEERVDTPERATFFFFKDR